MISTITIDRAIPVSRQPIPCFGCRKASVSHELDLCIFCVNDPQTFTRPGMQACFDWLRDVRRLLLSREEARQW